MSEPDFSEEGGGFRICGVVKRKFTASSGTFGTLDLEYMSRDNRKTRNRLKTFADTVVNELAQLSEGDKVIVTGEVSQEKVTNKAKEAVKVDGYDLYVPLLRLRTIKVDPSSQGTKEPESEPPLDLSTIPF